MTNRITIRQPDDWHLHLRDAHMLESVLSYTSAHFARAIVMPNLVPPVVTTDDARAYRARVDAATPASHAFEPLMTVYLTEQTDPDDLERGFADRTIHAVKLYPAGATTNSESGVRSVNNVMPVLERMASIGMPLLIHGEVTDRHIDIFDREAVFIDSILIPLKRELPELKVVLEHITTRDGVQFVSSMAENTAATITPHHLVWNRTHLFEGGLRPHRYCLPVVKREEHRQALLDAALSGDPRFFLGTDSAPHLDGAKESSCGCAGVFNVVTTLSTLAHVFEEAGQLAQLEAFVAESGANFYGLPLNERMVTLERLDEPWAWPTHVDTPDGRVTVFDPGFPLHWTVVN